MVTDTSVAAFSGSSEICIGAVWGLGGGEQLYLGFGGRFAGRGDIWIEDHPIKKRWKEKST